MQGAVGAGLALVAVRDGLAWWLGLEVAVPLVLGLEVAVPLGLGLAVGVALGLGLAVSEGLAPGLAAPLLSSPLDDTAGLVVTVVCADELARPDEPDAVGFADGCVEAAAQVALALGAMPAMLLDESAALADAGAALLLSVDPAPDEAGGTGDGRAEIRADVGDIAASSRHDGQDHPEGEHGQASGEGRPEHRLVPVPGPLRRTPPGGGLPRGEQAPDPRAQDRDSWVPKAAMPPQMAITPCRSLAWADRDWIFSRIRSRPSAPGWIWSPAA